MVVHRWIPRFLALALLLAAVRADAADESDEFEHVIEQLEGLELVSMADRHDGAWRSSAGMFETDRAIRAGRAVAEEMLRQRGSDKFVEQVG